MFGCAFLVQFSEYFAHQLHQLLVVVIAVVIADRLYQVRLIGRHVQLTFFIHDILAYAQQHVPDFVIHRDALLQL